MYQGLDVPMPQVSLTPEQEDDLEECFAFLSIAPSELYALPEEKRETVKAFMKTWHTTKLILTRTAFKKK